MGRSQTKIGLQAAPQRVQGVLTLELQRFAGLASTLGGSSSNDITVTAAPLYLSPVYSAMAFHFWLFLFSFTGSP